MDDSEADPHEVIIILSFILVLTLINAFFSSAEMALVSLDKKKLRRLVETGNKKAILLEKLIEKPTRFLSTIQVTITLAGFLSSAFAGSRLSIYIVSLFDKVGINLNLAVGTVIVTVILAFISLTFGELYPKRIALRNPERVALNSAQVINAFAILLIPFVYLLEVATNFLLKITGHHSSTPEEKVTEEEIRALIISGHIEGIINEAEREMLESIFRFDDLTAEAIMTPRINVFAINIEQPLIDHLDAIIARGFTRIPVYKGDIDNIIGILHVKDILREGKAQGFNNIKIKTIMRKPYFIPEYMKIDVLFRNMQKTKNQIAILIDEHGGSVGIVTIEDLVEEIVGNIYDEYDEVDKSIQTINEKTYIIDASIQIQELNRRLKLNIDENNEEYETLGGLVIYKLGIIPTNDYQEAIEFDDFTLYVKKANANRIDKIKLIKK